MLTALRRISETPGAEALYAALPIATRGPRASTAASPVSDVKATEPQQASEEGAQIKIRRGSPEYIAHMTARRAWRKQVNGLKQQWRQELWQQHIEKQKAQKVVVTSADAGGGSSSAASAMLQVTLEEELRRAYLEVEVVRDAELQLSYTVLARVSACICAGRDEAAACIGCQSTEAAADCSKGSQVCGPGNPKITYPVHTPSHPITVNTLPYIDSCAGTSSY